MPSITGSFSGRITKQSAMPLTDQPNHEMSIAEVSGTQKSPDQLWNNSKITYWGVTDLLDGNGSQRGYFNNVHPSHFQLVVEVTTCAGRRFGSIFLFNA